MRAQHQESEFKVTITFLKLADWTGCSREGKFTKAVCEKKKNPKYLVEIALKLLGELSEPRLDNEHTNP